jgi:hypothetical protein
METTSLSVRDLLKVLVTRPMDEMVRVNGEAISGYRVDEGFCGNPSGLQLETEQR